MRAIRWEKVEEGKWEKVIHLPSNRYIIGDIELEPSGFVSASFLNKHKSFENIFDAGKWVDGVVDELKEVLL